MIKNLPASAEDVGSIPRSGRSPGKGNGNSLQYSCLGNPIDRAAWQALVFCNRITKESDTTKQLNNNTASKALRKVPGAEFILCSISDGHLTRSPQERSDGSGRVQQAREEPPSLL